MSEKEDSNVDSNVDNFDSEAKTSGCQASKKLILILAIAIPVAVVVILAIVLGLVFGLKKKSSNEVDKDIFTPRYKALTSVPYYGEILSTTERKVATKGIHNENFSTKYPRYGSTLRDVIGTEPEKVEARDNIISESGYLAAYGTSNANTGHLTPDKYTWMDKDGFLYQGNVSHPVPSVPRSKSGKFRSNEQRKLYKHNASVGLYLGDVSDQEPGVVKKLVIFPRGYRSYSVTGLYAPAGEVIKVELSKADMDSSNGISIHIGQALYNGQANNIWSAKNQMQRFPIILTTLNINKNTAKLDNKTNIYTGYIGSFIGGPIYIRNPSATVTVTISGAVTYPHFILGVTTPEMFNESLKSSAPYFDLEVWNYGVLHSGPRYYVRSFSYDDLYKAATLWDKVACVTTYNNHQGVVFLYDPFVAAGAAVAFPGRQSVNCPLGWMTSSLNYNSVVTVGAWGSFHEYHHNFQGYGVGNGGEVTNNGLTLVSYALFTKISSNRKIGNYGSQGLDCWTSYTCSVYALNEVSKIKYSGQNPSNGNQGLALYACLLHNFGPDAYIKVKGYGGGQSYAVFMRNWQIITHNNMYYYFNELLGGTGISNDADPKYSTFVPIACIYQTGRSYLYYNDTTNKYEKRTFKSMQPYVIPYGVTFDIDLSLYTLSNGQYKSGSIYLPTNPDKSERFTYTVKSVSQPKNGKITKVNDLLYQYVPQKDQQDLFSGEIIATIHIEDKKKQLTIDDIDLILEFEMSHETLKTKLERTIYTYKSKIYENATDAYNNGFKGYEKVDNYDHSNPTQNCNTDIWFFPDTDENHASNPNAPDFYFFKDNRIHVIDGKLYFADDNKYRVYLRGRTHIAVYFSLDGNNYQLGASINELYSQSAQFKKDKNNTYFDIQFLEGQVNVTTYVEGEEKASSFKLSPDRNGDIRNWLYFKEVLIEEKVNNMISYTGLGSYEWTVSKFSMLTTYLDKDGNVITDSESPNITATWTNFSDYRGIIIARRKTYTNSPEREFYSENFTKISEEEFNDLTKESITPPTANPAYANAFRSSYQFPNNKVFESDYFYTRSYNYNYKDDPVQYMTWDEGVSLVATNFVAESATYAIENLFKEGYDNYIHPNENTAAGTYFTIDMGKEISASSITFHGRTDKKANTAQQGFPNVFALYISNDADSEYTKIGDFKNNDGDGNNANRAVTINLGKTYSFRYINITISSSHSNTGRIILSAIRFNYQFVLSATNNVIIINSDDVICTGNWQNKVALSTFGSVYVGSKGSKIKFEFTGTRLGILTSTKFGSNYQVNIDGKKVDSIEVKKLNMEFGITYISQKLKNQKHNVEIVCNGEANFDCFTHYTEND